MTTQFREQGLIVDEDVSHYDGTTAVVSTKFLGARDVEFLRWRAERWMKLKHLPAVLRHSPLFVMRHAVAMLKHTFAGSTWRSVVGLDCERVVFERYRSIRAASRLLTSRHSRAKTVPNVYSATGQP